MQNSRKLYINGETLPLSLFFVFRRTGAAVCFLITVHGY